MKKGRVVIILSVILLTTAFSLQAQNRRIQKADKYYKVGEYTKALELYTKLYAKAKNHTEKAELSFKAGLAARQLDNISLQLSWFRRALRYKYQDPKLYLYLAEAYKMRGAYDVAKQYYANYKDLVPDDPAGELGIQSCDLAQQWLNKPSRFIVNYVPKINSRYNDFAPAISNDTTTIYFTSTRPPSKGKKINPNTGSSFADIYVAQMDKRGQWSTPKLPQGDLNTEFDDGSCYITPDGTTMYFTRCPNVKDQNIGCQIWVAHLKDGQWTVEKQIKLFADSSISVGQPYLTPDQLTMYFVSDNPQGYGGKDIWMVKRRSTTSDWGQPVNLGPEINTKEDELFPSVDQDGNLYFSSRGHISMGGFDIFKATKQNGKWKVINLKSPINSPANDYRMVFIASNKGYLSSNRYLRNGDDIFYFFQRAIKIQLKGLIVNDKTRVGVEYADVIIEGSDGSHKKVRTDYDGVFKIGLKENTDYFLIVEKQGFLRSKASISTKGINQDTTLEMTIYLNQINQIVKIPNIRYFFNDTTLRPESKVALDKLIEILQLNPGIKVEIMAHTDYRGTNEYNMKLSQGRANSVVDYLIKHGIKRDRLVARGYGETHPFVVDAETAKKYPFLKKGQKLTEDFIKSLPSQEQQEICNELNRRTEFRVIGKIEHYEKFGSIPVDSTQTNTNPPQK